MYQSKNERNFHVFYQVLRSDDSALRTSRGRDAPRVRDLYRAVSSRSCWPLCTFPSAGEFGIVNAPEKYRYTSQSGCVDVPGIDDKAEYKESKVRIPGDRRRRQRAHAEGAGKGRTRRAQPCSPSPSRLAARIADPSPVSLTPRPCR